ncbi:hypothetical protein GGF32_001412, partial [Allomyces javanicus]
IWPAAFARPLLLPLDGVISPAAIARHAPSSLESGTVNGSLYAVPLYSDGGALFYRSDLLAKYGYSQPPTTWDHMELMLTTILAGERATNPSLAGFITQLSSYEGLTCNVAEWFSGANLTMFLDASSELTLDSAPAQAQAAGILSRFRRWIQQGLIPASSIFAFREMETLNMFEQGKAVFMRFWSLKGFNYRTSGLNLSWAMAPLPGESPDLAGASVFGANLIGINKYTRNVTRAARVAEFLSGFEAQRLYTTALGLRPTIPELFRDQYPAISKFIYEGVNMVLGGFADAATSVASINKLIADLLGIDHYGVPQNTQWNDPASIVVAAIVTFLVATIVFLAIWLFSFRDAAAARRVPTEFLVGVLLAAMLGSLVPLMYIGTPTPATCKLRVVLIGLGFTFMTSCMAAQDFRIYLIVSSPLRRVAADVQRILWQSLFAVWVFEAILLGVWLGLDPLAPVDVKVDDSWRYTGCASMSLPFQIAMYAAQCLLCTILVGLCVWLAVRNRNVSPKANTSGAAMSRVSYLIFVVAGTATILLSVLHVGPVPQVLTMTAAVALIVLSVLWAYLVVQLRATPDAETTSWMGTTIAASASVFSDASDDSSVGDLPSPLPGALHESKLAMRFARSERALQLAPWLTGVVVVYVVDAQILIVRSQPHGLVLSLRKLVAVSEPSAATRSFTATFAAGMLELWTRTETELKEWHARLAQGVPVGDQPTMHAPGGRGTLGVPASLQAEMAVSVQATYSSDDLYQFLTVVVQQKSTAWDLIGMDLIWPAAFAGPLLLPLDSVISPAAIARHVPSALESGTVNGSLYSVPLFSDGGALFYRSDLLAKYGFAQPPKTWDHMELMLTTILAGERATSPSLAGFVTQLSPYEGLTCNVAEWLAGANLTMFLDASSRLTLDSETAQAQAAGILSRFRRWIQQGLIPASSMYAFHEMETLNMFENGNAVFMRFWSRKGFIYRTSGLNLTWGMAPLPGESPDLAGASVFGAAVVGINKFTRNVTRAARVAEFLSGLEAQRLFTTALGLRPTIPELFQDPEVNRVYDAAFLNSTRIANRPSTSCKDQYPAISEIIYEGVNMVLGGFADAATSVASINKLIASLLGIDHYGAPQNTQWNDPASIAVAAIVAFMVATILFLAIRLFFFRDAAVARRIPAEFLVGVLIGSMLGSLVPLMFIGTPSVATCKMRVVLIGFGFTFMTSCMAAQDFRIYLIVSSPLRRVAAVVHRILWQSLVAVWAIEAILLGLWLGLDPLAPVDVKVDDAWRYTGCASTSLPFQIAMYAAQCLLCVILVGLCVWLAVRNRNVSPKANTLSGAMSRVSYLIFVVAGAAIVLLSVLHVGPVPQMLTTTAAVTLVVQSVLWSYLVVQLRVTPDAETSSWMGTTIAAPASAPSDATQDSSAGDLPGPAPGILHESRLAVRFARSERALQLAPWLTGVAVVHVADARILVVRSKPEGLVLSLRKLVSVSEPSVATRSFTATFTAGMLEVWTRTKTELKDWHTRLATAVPVGDQSTMHEPGERGAPGSLAAQRTQLTMSVQVATSVKGPRGRVMSD